MKQYSPEDLIEHARELRTSAYAPYSHYTVGAALLENSGLLYGGCNIENASYGATLCAERVAFSNAIAAGSRNFLALAVSAGSQDQPSKPVVPCGICLQFMSEFVDADSFMIYLDQGGDRFGVYTLRQLLPLGFALSEEKTDDCDGKRS